MTFFLTKARNDAKTVEEISKVREARKKLREFEAEMDKQLPSRKKLKKFRHMAKSLIEDHKYKHRYHESGQHVTDLERDKLNANIRKFEA